MKNTASVFLTLILVGTFTMAFNIRPVRASGSIYIRADGSIDPPTAPISTVDNITYTFIGNIYDSVIVVERDSIVVDGAGCVLQGAGSGTGIDLSGRNNVTVRNAEITTFAYGVYLEGSSNTISENNLTYSDAGIFLGQTASSNLIYANYIVRCKYGIWLYGSSGNMVFRNDIDDNERAIYFYSLSRRNVIGGNTLRNNDYGVYLRRDAITPGWQPDDNRIFHNNFVDNTDQVYSDSVLIENFWDNEYPSGGNYWSDYAGVDLHSGSYQNETGSDGLGDTPYIIDPYNEDSYPLNKTWISPDFSITVSPASLAIQQGSEDTVVIEIASVEGFDQPVQLSAFGAPPEVITNINPEYVTPPPGGLTESTLTVSVGMTTMPGSYTLDIVGNSSILMNGLLIPSVHSASVPLKTTALPPPEDITPPLTPAVTDDGEYTSNTTWLHATWDSSDPESGIAEYQYAIGTSLGGTEVVDWTSTGTKSEVTHASLNLIIGGTYFFSVKARNVKGLWSAVGTSDGIIVTTITFDLSPDWGSKELFVPVFYRSREDPSTVTLGVHSRRDMWYLITVYKRMPDKTWMETIPDEFLKGAGPYLGPWSEKTFLYTPQMGDEIKIQVWNDVTDGTLAALWSLDFVTRFLAGIRLPPSFPEYADWQTFTAKLGEFYNDFVKPLKDSLLSKAWKTALIELCKAILKAPQLYSSILVDLGFEPSVGAGIIVAMRKFVDIAFRFFALAVNIPTWWDFRENLLREPFVEDVVFTSKYRVLPATSNLRVTSSLVIVQDAPYYVGETIDAQFTVTNKGTAPVILDVITAGGRGPKGDADVLDFTLRTAIIIGPGNSYDYEGEVKLVDNGSYHFFVAYETSDGIWETNVPTEIGIVNTVGISVNPIPEEWVAAYLGSPGELRVYDSQGRVTGLVKGEEKDEIPYSAYYEDTVVLAGHDSYIYEVFGTGEGSYSLTVINSTVQETSSFNATGIPVASNALHQYIIGWDSLHEVKKGVSVCVDADEDGAFEWNFTADSKLTREEFLKGTSLAEGFPVWIVGTAVAVIALVSIVVTVFRRKRKPPPK